MQFKWLYYFEYSRSNGIFNIQNNDEILSVPHLLRLLIDLNYKNTIFQNLSKQQKNIHILKAWIKSKVAQFI